MRSLTRNRAIRIFQLLFLTIVFHATGFSQTEADSWPGWRGFSSEGVKDSASFPAEWSSEKNILWKMPIPGDGHSSPVLSGENIVVTTAYITDKNKLITNAINLTIVVLLIFLFILYTIFIYRSARDSTKSLLFRVLQSSGLSLVLGMVIYFSLTGIIFYQGSSVNHVIQICTWFYSGIFVTLCFMIATYTISNSLRFNIIAFILFASFASFLFFFRPHPEYYLLSGDGFLVERILKTGIVPLLFAFVVFISLFIKKRILALIDSTNGKKTSINILIIVIIFALAALFTGFYGIGVYRAVRYSDPSGILFLPDPEIFFRDSTVYIFMIYSSILLWAIVYIGNARNNLNIKSKGLAIVTLILAVLVFIGKNYVPKGEEYVRAIVCLDKNSGEIKWKREALPGPQQQLHHDNSPATPTPIIEGNHIYAYFGTTGLLRTDLKGNIQWENTDLPFEGIHGVGASPVLCNEHIIILSDMALSPYITAIDCNNGKEVWRQKRKSWDGIHGCQRTPTLKMFNGNNIVITWGYYGLNAYDAQSGNVLFDYPFGNSTGEMVASIISKGDTLFVPDRDKFHALSLSKLMAGNDPVIWQTDMNKKGPSCSSPAFSNNMIFMISDNGFASCLDANNGEILWQERISGTYMSSCVIVGDKVFFSNLNGQTTVIESDRDFNIIYQNKLPDPIYSSFAPTHDRIFIRTTKDVWCVGQ